MVDRDRRRFLGLTAGAGALLVVGAARGKENRAEDEVSPTEDLMREHGVLRRVLLCYDEALRRMAGGAPLEYDAIGDGARIVRDFIEDYHEKDEEEFVFPRVARVSAELASLVTTLRAQHQAGRALTDRIQRRAGMSSRLAPDDARRLADDLAQFARMYRAHAAREDTVLFPAFRKAVGEQALDRLREVFEERERKLPHGGFERMVRAVEKIEEHLGIADLAKLTP